MNDKSLPTDELRKAQISELLSENNIPAPSTEDLDNIVKATRGLASFPTEQVTALSMNTKGVDVAKLWGFKQKMIEASKAVAPSDGHEHSRDLVFVFMQMYRGTCLPSDPYMTSVHSPQ